MKTYAACLSITKTKGDKLVLTGHVVDLTPAADQHATDGGHVWREGVDNAGDAIFPTFLEDVGSAAAIGRCEGLIP